MAYWRWQLDNPKYLFCSHCEYEHRINDRDDLILDAPDYCPKCDEEMTHVRAKGCITKQRNSFEENTKL